jgi:hypothetical protein
MEELMSEYIKKIMDKPTTELHGPLQIHDPFGSTISDDVLNIPYSNIR